MLCFLQLCYANIWICSRVSSSVFIVGVDLRKFCKLDALKCKAVLNGLQMVSVNKTSCVCLIKQSKKKSLFQMTTFLFFSLKALPHKFLLDEHLLTSLFLVYFDCVGSQLTLQWTSMSTPAAAERTKVRCNFNDPFCSKRIHGEKQTSYPTVLPLRVHPKAHAWMEFLLLAM